MCKFKPGYKTPLLLVIQDWASQGEDANVAEFLNFIFPFYAMTLLIVECCWNTLLKSNSVIRFLMGIWAPNLQLDDDIRSLVFIFTLCGKQCQFKRLFFTWSSSYSSRILSARWLPHRWDYISNVVLFSWTFLPKTTFTGPELQISNVRNSRAWFLEQLHSLFLWKKRVGWATLQITGFGDMQNVMNVCRSEWMNEMHAWDGSECMRWFRSSYLQCLRMNERKWGNEWRINLNILWYSLHLQ